jgi:hypothetical protein
MSDTLTATQVGKKIRLVWTYTPAPSWPDAQGYIYNEGQHEDYWVEGMKWGRGTYSYSKESDHLYVSVAGEEGYISETSWVTDSKVDLTAYNKVKVDFSGTGTTRLVVSDIQMGISFQYVALLNLFSPPRQVYELDISGLSGEYYIRVHAWTEGDNVKVYCYKIWLE